jgi:hypothetical protein
MTTETNAPAPAGNPAEQQAAPQPESAQQPAPQAQAEQGDRPDWLPEKFKSPEDLAKSYSELEKKFASTVPESYDFDPLFQKHSLQWESDTQRDAVTKAFREARFTNAQIETALGLYAESVSKIAASAGAPVDIEAEGAKLKQEWGDEYDAKRDAISQFARTLPKDVLDRPIAATAEGMKLLERLMQTARGPELVKGADSAEGGGDLAAELQSVISDPEYYSSTPKGRQLQARADAITRRMHGGR